MACFDECSPVLPSQSWRVNDLEEHIKQSDIHLSPDGDGDGIYYNEGFFEAVEPTESRYARVCRIKRFILERIVHFISFLVWDLFFKYLVKKDV